ncbi:hypothetical protein H0N98_03485 [Candidatus Micrarchaeota archaeon]|nr:hypothetical protein [Candidatus Micrarchaeota archaeon]
MPVKLEEKYPLTGFKIDEKGYVKGKIGPHEVIVDQHLNIFILGKSEETKRRWVADYLPGGFWFSVAEEKEGLVCQVYMMDGKPHFPKYLVVDEGLYERTTGKKELGAFLTFDGVKDALDLYEKGKLSLAEYGNNALAKKRLKTLRGIREYEAEIREAAQLFLEVERIKEHPEVLKLRKEKGVIKPLTGEKAQMLAAIDSIERGGERVTPRSILKFLKKSEGVEGAGELAGIIKIGVLRKELESEGYVKILRGNERTLTDLGRMELEEYNKRKSSYVI